MGTKKRMADNVEVAMSHTKSLRQELQALRHRLERQSDLVKASYAVPKGQLGPFSFWAAVDDDGKGKGAVTECDERNNGSSISGVKCYSIK